MATIRDIAKKAGVSVATVSRCMDPDKKHLVLPETQEQIEKIIRQQHYIPNRSAQSLSKRSSNTIGMVTPFSTDVVKSNYFEGLIAGIIEGIKPLPYDLKWIMVRDEDIEQCSSKELLQKHFVDGVIFLSWRIFPKLVKEIGSHAHLPAVLINDYEPEVRSSIIYCDNQKGVEEIYSYFVTKGYKTIGMLRGPEYISLDAKDRFRAFRQCAKKFKSRFHESLTFECVRFDETEGYQAMCAWIERGNLPRAIFCANDDIARGAIQALRKHKIRVPEQIAIAGFDDSEKNKSLNPSLTSVRQPLETMGRVAVETLSSLISGKMKSPVQMKFKPELVIRESA